MVKIFYRLYKSTLIGDCAFYFLFNIIADNWLQSFLNTVTVQWRFIKGLVLGLNRPVWPITACLTRMCELTKLKCIAVMQIIFCCTCKEIKKPTLCIHTCHFNKSQMKCLSRSEWHIISGHIITAGLQD